ncbi:uncharacterized protein E5676_scaffold648G002130 [Cucumis melo var. makuwa]|uniref:Uncharacterized protein n=1 Tax=Cucumis melo var. makuwa TaxID=1194695 RepID=A0A5D3CAR7_CUCMM|nr:uncharacterized protein E6C27_scaffold115G002620 [Cucumis melo var. makuwa]TYK08392.1 uncharacterized protein E5676_scaffold648G002130 [Cucumis melo var. makuwa]
MSWGESDDHFIYEITSPTSSSPPPFSVSLSSSPSVHRVYSRHPPQKPSNSCPSTLTSLPSDSGPSDNLPIALRKGKWLSEGSWTAQGQNSTRIESGRRLGSQTESDWQLNYISHERLTAES